MLSNIKQKEWKYQFHISFLIMFSKLYIPTHAILNSIYIYGHIFIFLFHRRIRLIEGGLMSVGLYYIFNIVYPPSVSDSIRMLKSASSIRKVGGKLEIFVFCIFNKNFLSLNAYQ